MDERKRDLERAAGGGNLEARARLLLERIRSGDIKEKNLRLGLLLGSDECALALSQEKDSRALRTIHDVEDWLNELEAVGLDQVRQRFLLALANKLREIELTANWDIINDAEAQLVTGNLDPDGLRTRVEAAQAWANHLDRVPDELRDREYSAVRAGVDAFHEVAGIKHTKAQMATVLYDAVAGFGYVRVVDAVTPGRTPINDRAVNDMVDVVRSELLPWALGDFDPVKQRVNARVKAEEAAKSDKQRRQQADDMRRQFDEQIEQ